jgi:small subunit ribosomal protein S20
MRVFQSLGAVDEDLLFLPRAGWCWQGSLLASCDVANIKSQKKRILTNAKRQERNKAVKSELRTRVKSATASVGTETNTEDVRLAMKRLDKAATKGIIHPNQAARRKSRLMKKINAAAK